MCRICSFATIVLVPLYQSNPAKVFEMVPNSVGTQVWYTVVPGRQYCILDKLLHYGWLGLCVVQHAASVSIGHVLLFIQHANSTVPHEPRHTHTSITLTVMSDISRAAITALWGTDILFVCVCWKVVYSSSNDMTQFCDSLSMPAKRTLESQ